MIHSLAGGKIKDLDFADFVKVEILEGLDAGKIMWFITDILDLAANNNVLVPLGFGNTPTLAKVLKIERNLSSHVAPIPIKKAKMIIKKLTQQ